jgi:predicted transporter
MEIKTLWLGLLLSMATFAIKTGLGWAYLCSVSPRSKRPWFSLAIIAAYGALFAGVALLVAKVNLIAHYQTFAPLWRNGVALHWLTALMLLLWGIILLSKPESENCCHSKGWLALVIPCPVCLSVVLMSAAALSLYFPEQALKATAALFVSFVLVAALAGFLMSIKKGDQAIASSKLGLFMCIVAAYFMLSALISPPFAEFDQVYSLAIHARSDTAVPLVQKIGCIAAIFLLAATGFFITKRRIGKQL